MERLTCRNLTITIFALSLILSSFLSNAQTNPKDEKNTQKTPEVNQNKSDVTEEAKKPKYTREMVESNMKEIHAAILKGKKDEHDVSAMQFTGFARAYDFFGNYPDIEKLTGISRDWFLKVKKSLADMYTPKEMMITAEANNDKAKYEKSKLEYETALEQYIKLYENPVKIKKKKK